MVSRAAAEAAGLDVAGQTLHEMPVKGRTQPIQFYALQAAQESPA